MKKIVIVLFIFLFFGCTIGEEKYDNKYNPNDYELEITTKKLKKVYSNNVLDGNKKYFGKRIKVESTYKSVSNGTISGLILYLDDVYCSSFNTKKDAAVLSELDKGQKVIVIGTVGEWISNSLNLEDCQIIVD